MQAHSYEQFQRKKEKHGWINFRGGEINLPLAGFFTTKSRAQFRFNSLRFHNDQIHFRFNSTHTGFNSNSIFKVAHWVSTRFTIQFSHQYFISIQFTIQFSSPTFHFISIHNSTSFKAGCGVINKYHFPHPCWVYYGEISLDCDCYGT